jgi:hypothetical protein
MFGGGGVNSEGPKILQALLHNGHRLLRCHSSFLYFVAANVLVTMLGTIGAESRGSGPTRA